MAEELTERQAEIKALEEQGRTPREIGELLGISENAVYQHFRRMRKGGKVVRTSAISPRGTKVASVTARKPRSTKSAPAVQGALGVATSGVTLAPSKATAIATPLQAIRARREALAAELNASLVKLDLAAKAHTAATEWHEKLVAKHGPEMEALQIAEAAITGKAVATPKPRRRGHTIANEDGPDLRPHGKASASKAPARRVRAKAASNGNGSDPQARLDAGAEFDDFSPVDAEFAQS